MFIGENFYFCADRFRFTSEDLNLLTRPRAIVDRHFQAQLTEMDLIFARQVLELIFVRDGSGGQNANKCSVDILIIL